jgi:phage terminase large subunit-like protein
MAKTNELVERWRERGPIEWSQGAYGWIGIDGEPITLRPWQEAVLEAWWKHRNEVTTLAVSNIKKTGKTLLDALLLAWRWIALPGLHFAVANDLDQSTGRQFAEIADMVKRNAYLRENVRITAKQLEFTPTGSLLQALAGDASGNAGANHFTTSHTECWGILYEQDIRNWEELTPPPGRFYGLPALRIADSYAGWLEESNTWHELVDRGLEGKKVVRRWPIYQDGGLMLFHMAGTEAQKRCFPGTREEAKVYYHDQRVTLRENSYKRLHENMRTVNIGTFIDQDDWEALIDPDHHPLPPGSPDRVFVGLDLAISAGGDDCALIGVYKDDIDSGRKGKVKVAFHKVWKGRDRKQPLSLSDTVVPYLIKLNYDYQLMGVWFDPWQAKFLVEVLGKNGIHCHEVPQTHGSRGPKDTTLYELASTGNLVLYDHYDLRHMSAGANAKDLSNGQIFLEKVGGRLKIDLLVALSNVADVLYNYVRFRVF